MQEKQVQSLGQEDLLDEELAAHSDILAWKKSHGQRSLAGYSPSGCKESDMTSKWACTHTHTHTHINKYIYVYIYIERERSRIDISESLCRIPETYTTLSISYTLKNSNRDS